MNHIEPALADLKRLRERLTNWNDQREFAREKMSWLIGNPRLDREPSWDAAEQTYLAMQVLNATARDELMKKRLDELLDQRTWPPPVHFDPSDVLTRLRALKK